MTSEESNFRSAIDIGRVSLNYVYFVCERNMHLNNKGHIGYAHANAVV